MKELSLNILDIAQNSITAGADEIRIEIDETTASSVMVIKITDNGCGMSAETVAKVIDPFYTSRRTRKVGLGIPFYKMAAEMTGGGLTIDSTVGKGTVITATFRTDNIDFVPLGDMPSTYCTLVQGSPEIDFVFIHRKDENAIEYDTKKIREALGGDVSLAEFEVISWISESMKEEYSTF